MSRRLGRVSSSQHPNPTAKHPSLGPMSKIKVDDLGDRGQTGEKRKTV